VIVQKYGGTSVATAARIRRISRRIADTVAGGERVVAVVSAMGHTTDRLIGLARQVTAEPPARELDMLVANGETITAPLVAMCLQGMGVPAVSLSGAQAGVRTSPHHSRARIRDVRPDRVLRELESGRVPVVAGFQGVTEDSEVTTLGRGGSDTTAVALAAALGATNCQIYTDVDGIMTADPRVVPDARMLPAILYEEMLELASAGARVMHPRAVEIGQLYGVAIHVRSSFHRRPGTIITSEVPLEERNRVRGVAVESGIAKITVVGVPDRPGVAAALFAPLGEAGISVDVIVQNVSSRGLTDLTFTVSEADMAVAVRIVTDAARTLGAGKVTSSRGMGKVSLVGTGMMGTPGIAGRMFSTLARARVNIEMISTSEIRITCLVDGRRLAPAARALHSAFRLEQDVVPA
jgi:aspartate kinase